MAADGGAASNVKFATSSDADSFYYNTDTMSAIYLRAPLGIVLYETGVIHGRRRIRRSPRPNASSISQPKAEDVPDCVDKLATAIAGGQSRSGEAAQSLPTSSESGWFSHGLNGDYPSRAGHGNYRIDQLLAGSAMVGDSEIRFRDGAYGPQSRLAGAAWCWASCRRTTRARSVTAAPKHGKTTTTKFTGNDVTAWVEIASWTVTDGWRSPDTEEKKVPDENQESPLRPIRRPWCVSLRCRLPIAA